MGEISTRPGPGPGDVIVNDDLAEAMVDAAAEEARRQLGSDGDDGALVAIPDQAEADAGVACTFFKVIKAKPSSWKVVQVRGAAGSKFCDDDMITTTHQCVDVQPTTAMVSSGPVARAGAVDVLRDLGGKPHRGLARELEDFGIVRLGLACTASHLLPLCVVLMLCAIVSRSCSTPQHSGTTILPVHAYA